jgi:hypothetical protein
LAVRIEFPALVTARMDFNKLQYLPLALPHFSLLAVIFLVLVAWIEVRAAGKAHRSLISAAP